LRDFCKKLENSCAKEQSVPFFKNHFETKAPITFPHATFLADFRQLCRPKIGFNPCFA